MPIRRQRSAQTPESVEYSGLHNDNKRRHRKLGRKIFKGLRQPFQNKKGRDKAGGAVRYPARISEGQGQDHSLQGIQTT